MTRLSAVTRINPVKVVFLIFLILLGFVLQGCGGGGGGGGSSAAADPTGYYDVTGTANVKESDNTTDLMITDLQAMVSGNRIMIMSTANGLLYDGTITNITQNSFTADFVIYTDGKNPVAATASGTITEGSSITGTLTGTGAGNGTFSLVYALGNNQAADLGRIDNSVWDGDLAVGPNYTFSISSLGVLTSQGAAGYNVPIFDFCEINGTVMPINGTSLYSVTAALTNCGTPAVNGSTYTGFATSRTNAVVDDTLVFVLSNGTYSPNGELIH